MDKFQNKENTSLRRSPKTFTNVSISYESHVGNHETSPPLGWALRFNAPPPPILTSLSPARTWCPPLLLSSQPDPLLGEMHMSPDVFTPPFSQQVARDTWQTYVSRSQRDTTICFIINY